LGATSKKLGKKKTMLHFHIFYFVINGFLAKLSPVKKMLSLKVMDRLRLDWYGTLGKGTKALFTLGLRTHGL